MMYVIIVSILLSYFQRMFFPQYGNTPTHWASMKGHPEVIKLLVQSHTNMNVKNNVSTESLSLVPFTFTPYIVHLVMFTIN